MSFPIRIVYKGIEIYYDEDLYYGYVRFFCGRCQKLLGKFNLNVVNDYVENYMYQQQETIFDFFKRSRPYLLRHLEDHISKDNEVAAAKQRKLRLIRRD